jgi:hypothetical protein
MYQISDPDLRAKFESASTKLPLLRDEIALLRANIEKRVSLCKTDAEHIALFDKLSGVLLNLAKLEKAELELSLAANETLSKLAANKLADTLGRLLLEEIRNLLPNPDAAVDRLQAKFAAAVADATNAA